jgi:hypothetical protein
LQPERNAFLAAMFASCKFCADAMDANKHGGLMASVPDALQIVDLLGVDLDVGKSIRQRYIYRP